MQQLIHTIDRTVKWSPRELTLLVVDYAIPQQWHKRNAMSRHCLSTANSIVLPESPWFAIENDPDSKHHGLVRLSWTSGCPEMMFVTHHWYLPDQTYRFCFELYSMQEVLDKCGVIQDVAFHRIKRINWHPSLKQPPLCHALTDATLDYVVTACASPFRVTPTVEVSVIPFQHPHHAMTFDLPMKTVYHVTIWQGLVYLLVGKPETLFKYSLSGQLKGQHLLEFQGSSTHLGILEARGFQQWILMVEQTNRATPMTDDRFPVCNFRYILLNVATNQLFYSPVTHHPQHNALVGLDQDFMYTEFRNHRESHSTFQRFHWSIENEQFHWKPCFVLV